MSDRKGYSGEYWNLHRNSLLFSAALFLLSISSKTTKVPLVGLDFGNLGANAILMLVSVAATYSFVAFLFEWREECFPLVYLNFKQLKSASERINEAANQLYEVTYSFRNIHEKIDVLLHKHTDNLPNRTLPCSRIAMETYSEIYRGITERYYGLHPDGHVPDSVNGSINAEASSASLLLEALKEKFERIEINSDDEFYKEFEKFSQSLDKLNSNVHVPVNYLNSYKTEFVRPISFEIGRGVVVAALAPISLYVVAMPHALWHLGLHWFVSPLIRILQLG